MFEFNQQLKWPANQFLSEANETQHPQLTYSISNQTVIFQRHNISSSIQNSTLDQTQQKKKKNDKLKKNEKGNQQIELHIKLLDEKEADLEEQINEKSKLNSYFKKKYLISQNINIDEQFKNLIQIYIGNVLIDDQIVKNKLINEIIGDLNQLEKHQNILGEYIKNQQHIIMFNNNNNTSQYSTIQRLYYRKDDTCSVSVKTCISQDAQKFVVQKIFEKTARQTPEQFENQVKYEIDILKNINQSKTLITLPFINEEISQDSNQNKIYILNIDSGIKNLIQVKHFYIANKNYEEYNVILEYAFCQLLLKLNEMHSVCKIAHSDIKPANIIIGYDLQFYFIDFGASIYLDNINSCNQYLRSYTKNFNLNLFLEKKENEWKYEEIIDCDTSQLILSFLYMIDVEDNYYQSFKNLNSNNFEDCKKNIKPEFKRLGKYLLRSLMYIIQKQEDSFVIPPKQKIFLFSDFAEQLTNTFNNQYDIKYNQKDQHYEVISINRFSIQIIDIIIQNDPNCKFLFNEKTQIDYIINREENEEKNKRNISKYPNICQFFQLQQEDILSFAVTNLKFNNKIFFVNKFLLENKKTPMIEFQDDIFTQVVQSIDKKRLSIYFKQECLLIQNELMSFEIKEELDLFQICFDSIDQNKIKKYINSILINMLNEKKLQQIILLIDYKLLNYFNEIIDNLKQDTLSKNIELALQIFLNDIENLFQDNIWNLKVDFKINIQHQITQQNLIQILCKNGYPSNCTNIVAQILFDENQDQNLKISYPFQITQMYDRYILITLSEISLNSLQISMLKETAIKYLEYQKKYTSQHQVSQSQINKNNSQILQNILQNKNQRKQFQIFLISFQQKIEQDANLNFTCDLFQNIHLFQVNKSVKIRNNAYLKFYQESKQKFNSDYEQELIFRYINSKLSGKNIKNLDLDLSYFNFKMGEIKIEPLRSKLQKHQLFSLNLQFKDSLFYQTTLVNFLKCIKLYKFGKVSLNFYNVEFQSIKSIKAVLDFLYSNKILFLINIQQSKLINQQDFSKLAIQYCNKNLISLQFLKEDNCFIHLIIDQSLNNKLIIKSLNGLDPESLNDINIQLEDNEDHQKILLKHLIHLLIFLVLFFNIYNPITLIYCESQCIRPVSQIQIVEYNLILFIMIYSQYVLTSSTMYNKKPDGVLFLHFLLLTDLLILVFLVPFFTEEELDLQYGQIIQSLASFLLIYYKKKLCKFKVILETQINKIQAQIIRDISKKILIISFLVNIIIILFNLSLIITQEFQMTLETFIISFFLIVQFVICEIINIYYNFNELTYDCEK